MTSYRTIYRDVSALFNFNIIRAGNETGEINSSVLICNPRKNTINVHICTVNRNPVFIKHRDEGPYRVLYQCYRERESVSLMDSCFELLPGNLPF